MKPQERERLMAKCREMLYDHEVEDILECFADCKREIYEEHLVQPDYPEARLTVVGLLEREERVLRSALERMKAIWSGGKEGKE